MSQENVFRLLVQEIKDEFGFLNSDLQGSLINKIELAMRDAYDRGFLTGKAAGLAEAAVATKSEQEADRAEAKAADHRTIEFYRELVRQRELTKGKPAFGGRPLR